MIAKKKTVEDKMQSFLGMKPLISEIVKKNSSESMLDILTHALYTLNPNAKIIDQQNCDEFIIFKIKTPEKEKMISIRHSKFLHSDPIKVITDELKVFNL